jgi:hypothetical protein
LAAGRLGSAPRRLGWAAGLVGLCLGWSGLARSDPAANGFTVPAELQHAAFHVAGVPSVIAHAPAGLDPARPLELVVFLHGYSCCVPVLMAQGESRCRPGAPPSEGWNLGAIHDAAGTQSLFVVPQLAFLQRNGDPGAFARPGEFRAFLEELLARPLAAPLGRARKLREIAGLHLVAHSGGYQALLAILERGGVQDLVKSVVLLDALYGETPRFAAYVEAHPGVHFVSIALAQGNPQRENAQLLRRLRRTIGAPRIASADASGLVQAIAEHPIVIATGTPPHRLLPATHLAEVLRALLPSRATSP